MTEGISLQFFGPPRIQLSAEQQAFRSNVKSLIDAIKSGDLGTAKEAYAKIGDTSSGKTDNDSDTDSPFAKLIAQIGAALQSEDIAAAKEALSTFEANRPSGPPPGGGPRPGGPSEAERSAFAALVDALKSSDLNGSKQAYATLLDARGSSDSSSNSPIDTFLEQIGAALDANDLGSAQTALEQLAQHRPQGGALDVSA